MKNIFLVFLLAAVGFGSWKYDTSRKTSEYQPVVAAAPKRARSAVRPTPTPKVERPKGRLASKQVRARVAKVTDGIKDVRGLELKKPVATRFLSQEELATRWKIDLKKEWPESERIAEEKTLIAFGFMSARSSLSNLVDESAGEGIAGFYEHDTDNLYIIGDEKDMGALNRLTLAHELTHAMQDQTYNLEKMFAKVETHDDRALALRSLVEGDATLSERLYMGKERMSKEDLMAAVTEESLTFQSYEEGPPVMGLTFVFPYIEGAEWVQQLYDRNGWSGVNAAYTRVPESTEQILHPEKYHSGDSPVSVKLPDVSHILGKDWKKLRTNTLGEYQSLVLVSGGATEEPVFKAAAAGWEGDRYTVYSQRKGNGTALMWESQWESEKDASEFTVALALLHEELNQNVYGEQLKRRDGAIALDGADASIRIRRIGKSVYFVVARDTKPELADRLLEKLMN